MKKMRFFFNALCLLAVLFITACNNDTSSSKESTRPEPTITSITPTNSSSIGAVSISSIRGTNFSADAEVNLSRAGESDITATSIVMVNKETLTCDFDLTGAATGEWDIVITVPEPGGGTATLSSGFTVTNALYVSATGDDAASDPVSVNNNNIFDCGTALYYDEGNTAITTAAGLNLIAGAALNISIDAEFADETGGDWHLTADTPATITTGGLNGYDESWTFFPQTGSSFIDKDMALRPASGTGWAIGAYQYVSP